MSIWKKVELVERKGKGFYDFSEGTHVLTVLDIADKEEPFLLKQKGKEARRVIRMTVENAKDKQQYNWWLDVTAFWNEDKRIFEVPNNSTSVRAQILKLGHELGGLEGKVLQINIVGKGTDRRYSVSLLEAGVEEEVSVKPEELFGEEQPAEPSEIPDAYKAKIVEDTKRLKDVLDEAGLVAALSNKYPYDKTLIGAVVKETLRKAAAEVKSQPETKLVPKVKPAYIDDKLTGKAVVEAFTEKLKELSLTREDVVKMSPEELSSKTNFSPAFCVKVLASLQKSTSPLSREVPAVTTEVDKAVKEVWDLLGEFKQFPVADLKAYLEQSMPGGDKIDVNSVIEGLKAKGAKFDGTTISV